MSMRSSPQLQRQMRHSPCPWGAHSLLNTGGKLNTGHASWVAPILKLRNTISSMWSHRCNDQIGENVPWRSPEGPGGANHLPTETSWLCSATAGKKKEGTPPHCGNWATVTRNHPGGPAKNQNETTNASFHQLHRLHGNSNESTPQSCS